MRIFSNHKRVRVFLQSPQQTPKKRAAERVAHILLWLPYTVGLLLVSVVGGVFWLVSGVCHAVGLAVMWPPKTIARLLRYSWQWLLKDIEETLMNMPVKLLRAREPQFAYGLLLFLTLVGTVFGVLKVGSLLAEGVYLRGRVLGETSIALSQLESGKAGVMNDNLEEAQNKFSAAMGRFRNGVQALDNSNVLVKALLQTLPVGRDAQNLLVAGQSASEAAVHVTKIFQGLEGLHIDESGVHADGEKLSGILNNFELAKDAIHRAYKAVSQVDPRHLPEDKRDQFVTTQSQLQLLDQSLESVGQALELFSIFNQGHKHVLVLLQNSNELRASGGFLGTYGAFDLEDGRVTKQVISSIYDLDGQLQTKYAPPLPLRAVNTRWFMRDANWFASFPESAEAIIGFYEEEAKQTPDLVLAITPQLATRLLALTGPIDLPQYGTRLDADNFVEVTQIETSIEYDKETNKPKQMLADFFPLFVNRISALPKTKLPEVFFALEQSLLAKDMQIYARDQHTEETLQKLGFSGRLQNTSRDYLGVFSSNLGGTKTDLAMEQNLELQSSLEPDGSIINTLTIRRYNPLPRAKGLENKDFLRVYVPLGSKLLKSEGFSSVEVGPQSTEKATTHPQAEAWEDLAVREVRSGTLVGEEGGKTYFGNWVVLEGGQRAAIKLVYRLPFKLDAVDRHSLVVQKQAGANAYLMKYNFKMPGHRVVWATEETDATTSLYKELSIDKDRFFGVVLQSGD